MKHIQHTSITGSSPFRWCGADGLDGRVQQDIELGKFQDDNWG